jgi:REP element-mobilizing transposase RayT
MRKTRKIEDNARYHVGLRTNRKEMIFKDNSVKELFLSILRRAQRKHCFRIDNFCIMNNHIHMIIQPLQGESLSSIMQWIASVFAMAYNKIRNITGHVWGERFFSRIIRSFQDFINVVQYIDDNPAKAVLVSNPRDWQFGGLWQDRTGIASVLDADRSWIMLVCPHHARLLLPLYHPL